MTDPNQLAQEFCVSYGEDCPYKKDCNKAKRKRGEVLLTVHHKYGQPTTDDVSVVRAFKKLPECTDILCRFAHDEADKKILDLPSHERMKQAVESSKYTKGISNTALKRTVLKSIYEKA